MDFCNIGAIIRVIVHNKALISKTIVSKSVCRINPPVTFRILCSFFHHIQCNSVLCRTYYKIHRAFNLNLEQKDCCCNYVHRNLLRNSIFSYFAVVKEFYIYQVNVRKLEMGLERKKSYWYKINRNDEVIEKFGQIQICHFITFKSLFAFHFYRYCI